MYKRSLHVFRRDLRLEDNSALLAASESSEEVIPCFCFDPRQVKDNAYLAVNALAFMCESLQELDERLQSKGSQLYVFSGKAEKRIPEIAEQLKVDSVYLNVDYTPFAQARDQDLKKALEKKNIAFHGHHDALLNEPGAVSKDDGKPYTVFTPYWKKAKQNPVQKPSHKRVTNYFSGTMKGSDKNLLVEYKPEGSPERSIRGGRKAARSLLRRALELTDYSTLRDIPSERGTSWLSAHHKFGTLSAREVYWEVAEALGEDHTLLQELHWRDFFSQIAFHFPHVFEGAFRKEYDKVSWSDDKKLFQAWCQGKTGFPIVDAGMRELNATGYMHNRVRMIVASFLTKDLHINWRWGEKYFARKLVDYDPAVSTGCDAQPYFRIFNPWRQQEKFDAEAKYIKKWIPELSALSAKEIHKLEDSPLLRPSEYPESIVDHSIARDEALDRYSVVKKNK